MPNNEAPGTVNNNNNTWTESKSFFLSVIALVAAMLALGMQIKEDFNLRENLNKATVSENHWRDQEVRQKADHEEIEKLKEELSHVRR